MNDEATIPRDLLMAFLGWLLLAPRVGLPTHPAESMFAVASPQNIAVTGMPIQAFAWQSESLPLA